MKLFGSIVIVLAACVVGNASDCRRVAVVTTHHAPYVPYVAPLATYYTPGYSVGYAPDSTEAFLKLFAAYKEKAEQHEALLRSLVAAGGTPPGLKAALAPPSPGLAVLNAACARCHDASSAPKTAGGGYRFLNAGAFIDDDKGDNFNRVMLALKTGKMGSMDLPKLDPLKKLDAVFFLTELGAKEAEPKTLEAPRAKPMPPAIGRTPLETD